MPGVPAYIPETPSHHIQKRRRCLFCREAFDSAWAGERICPACKGSA
jgi:hypothetical protein